MNGVHDPRNNDPSGEQLTEKLTMVLSKPMKAQLNALAFKQDRSVGYVIRAALQAHLSSNAAPLNVDRAQLATFSEGK